MEKKEKKIEWAKILPFILCFVVILLDQLTKAWVVANIGNALELGYYDVKYSWFDGFVRIVHIRNTGVAFSMGDSWPDVIRKVIFILVPIVVIAIVIRIYFKSKDLTGLQRWCICGIIGGGIGNLIDRIFRFKTGVVDFIDVKWFGLEKSPFPFLRWDRWPTFNVGDAAVVVCGILLLISFIVMYVHESKKEKKSKQEKK